MKSAFKKTNISTTTYRYKNGYMVDVVMDKNTWEFWLYHRDIGAKDFMYGLPGEQMECMEDMLDILLANIDKYIDIYKANYVM